MGLVLWRGCVVELLSKTICVVISAWGMGCGSVDLFVPPPINSGGVVEGRWSSLSPINKSGVMDRRWLSVPPPRVSRGGVVKME